MKKQSYLKVTSISKITTWGKPCCKISFEAFTMVRFSKVLQMYFKCKTLEKLTEHTAPHRVKFYL